MQHHVKPKGNHYPVLVWWSVKVFFEFIRTTHVVRWLIHIVIINQCHSQRNCEATSLCLYSEIINVCGGFMWKRCNGEGGGGKKRKDGKQTCSKSLIEVLKEEEKWKSLWSAGRDGIKSPLFHYHTVAVKVEVQCVALRGFVTHWKAQWYTHLLNPFLFKDTLILATLWSWRAWQSFFSGAGLQRW